MLIIVRKELDSVWNRKLGSPRRRRVHKVDNGFRVGIIWKRVWLDKVLDERVGCLGVLENAPEIIPSRRVVRCKRNALLDIPKLC